jgi:hypothetical protein
MEQDSSDLSGSQLSHRKIFRKYPTCFPEQHHEGYGKFIQASEKDIKMYKGLYGKRVAPLIFFADEMMNKGGFILSGKDVDLQFFLPEGWNYSARGREGVIKIDGAIYSLSPEIFQYLAQICFFLPAQEFLKTALTHPLSQEDETHIKEQLANITKIVKGLHFANRLENFKPLPAMRADRDTSTKVKALLEDLKYHRANGVFFRDKEGMFEKFCLGLTNCIIPLESVLYTDLPISQKKDVATGIKIIAKEVEEFNATKSLFLKQIPSEFKTGKKSTVKITTPSEDGTFSRLQEITPVKISTTLNLTTNLKSFSDKYALFLMDFLSDFEETITKEHLDILATLSSASINLKSLEEEMQQILSKHPETAKKK